MARALAPFTRNQCDGTDKGGMGPSEEEARAKTRGFVFSLRKDEKQTFVSLFGRQADVRHPLHSVLPIHAGAGCEHGS